MAEAGTSMRLATAAFARAGTSAIVGTASPGAAASKIPPAIKRCFTGILSNNHRGGFTARSSSTATRLCSRKLIYGKFIVIRRAEEARVLAFARRSNMKIIPVLGTILKAIANANKPVENPCA